MRHVAHMHASCHACGGITPLTPELSAELFAQKAIGAVRFSVPFFLDILMYPGYPDVSFLDILCDMTQLTIHFSTHSHFSWIS